MSTLAADGSLQNQNVINIQEDQGAQAAVAAPSTTTGGSDPSTLAETALLSDFGVPAFPVDTHIHRLAQRWGLTSGKNVKQTEKDLKALFPKEEWNKLHLRIIFYGREGVLFIRSIDFTDYCTILLCPSSVLVLNNNGMTYDDV